MDSKNAGEQVGMRKGKLIASTESLVRRVKPMHPKQEEALKKSNYDKVFEEQTRQHIVELIKDRGISIMHIRNEDGVGAVTLAYKMPKHDNALVVEVAVATCHPNDVFCKEKGRQIAVEHFVNGKTVKVRLSPTMSATRQLKLMFGLPQAIEGLENLREQNAELAATVARLVSLSQPAAIRVEV